MSNPREASAILGFPRSGTTLLRRFLDAHSLIACPGETYLLSACARFLRQQPVVGGLATGVEHGLGFLGFSAAEIHRRLRELAYSFRREHLARVGKRYWAEKTAIDVFHLGAIEALFGEHLSFVFLFRHGLDVCASTREWVEKSETYPPELHPYIQRFPRPLEAFAHAWVDVCQASQAFLARHPTNAISLRYEDLVRDPEGQLRRVFDFLGVAWEPEVLERAHAEPGEGFGDWKAYRAAGVEGGSIGRWSRLPPSTQGELARIINPTLGQLGYPEVAAPEPLDPAEARRQYELALQFPIIP